MVSPMSALSRYFARRPDPYAGGDLDNAQRIGMVLFALQALLIVVLLPLSPPTDAIGSAGWPIAAVVIAAGVAVAYGMRTRRFGSWTALLLACYGAVAALELMQWLGG